MEPSVSVLTAILNSVAYGNDEYGEPNVPESEFLPFNLSYLRDFPDESEPSRHPFGGRAQDASGALHA
jgi:hypothetical protein